MQGVIQQHFYIANNLEVGGGSNSSAGDWAVKGPVQTNTLRTLSPLSKVPNPQMLT